MYADEDTAFRAIHLRRNKNRMCLEKAAHQSRKMRLTLFGTSYSVFRLKLEAAFSIFFLIAGRVRQKFLKMMVLIKYSQDDLGVERFV